MKWQGVLLSTVLLVVILTSFDFSTNTTVRAQTGNLPTLALTSPVAGLTQPVTITHAGDGSNRIFVVEQTGKIRIIKNGALLATPFLDISNRISTGGERGLLGLAFAPGYAAKGYFYVDYTNAAGDTVIARYGRNPANPDLADPASEQVIITIGQPYANHNGGQLAFSPRDGYLYIGMGDGGSGGDPENRAQNPGELLGKLLRIDVETGRPYTYTVPPSNPFANSLTVRREIWALGLRNPWRFAFDRQTGDLFTADVGQNAFEEVNFQPASSAGGENYGWRIMEGAHCFNPSNCSFAGLTLPVWEYDHSLGCSISGGYVYRGASFPRMQGLYIYGDFCSGRIWALRRDTATPQNTQLLDTTFQISTFGEDEAGELYVAAHNTGTIYKLVDAGPPATPNPTPVPATIHFNASALSVGEGQGSATVTVTRSGDTSAALRVDYATADATASERSDYTTTRGTLRFASGETTRTFNVFVTDDARAEGDEKLTLSLSNLVGPATLASPSTAELTITDNDAAAPAGNPIDNSAFFVRQHYVDFLNREPDAEGLQFWTNNIESCGTNAACREVKRIDTSAAFFLSIEFQETGFLVYRTYKAAYARLPRFREFIADTQQISRGVIIGQPGAAQILEVNKQAFFDELVARPEFDAQFPQAQTPELYVSALFTRAGITGTSEEQNALAAGLRSGTETRATVLRKIVERGDFQRAETQRAFVLMQYFGYLRRNPDDSPNADFSGYDFWLGKLQSFGGDFRRAEMVKAFIISTEYRARFGTP
jgi:glucose/arabinose dehydrogenase